MSFIFLMFLNNKNIYSPDNINSNIIIVIFLFTAFSMLACENKI